MWSFQTQSHGPMTKLYFKQNKVLIKIYAIVNHNSIKYNTEMKFFRLFINRKMFFKLFIVNKISNH